MNLHQETEMFKLVGRNSAGAGASRRGESGFTIVQLVLTIAILSIISTFAVMGISTVDSLDIPLEDGVTFDSSTPWTDITFNSRGRIPGETFFRLVNESSSS